MITIEGWLRQNKVPEEGIQEFRDRAEYRRFILAMTVDKSQAEVVTLDRKSNTPVFMKRVFKTNIEVDPTVTKVFLIGVDSWERMSKSNLWNEHLPQNEASDEE